MENINQLVRFNYTRIAETLQAELIFLSELAKITEDERFKQSITEVIYRVNDLSDAINSQRRYLKAR
jgi:acetylglutamate kinase